VSMLSFASSSLGPRLGALATVLATALTSAGCLIVDDHHRYDDPPPDYGYEPGPTTPGAGGAGSMGGIGGTAPLTPMLVEVDTDQTMTADPGRGVGVFVEYGAGGKWHVWWTCDTALTRKSCDVSLAISSGNGPIANIDTSEAPGGYVTSPSAARLDASILTTTEVHGLRFDTLPGVILTIDASISGLRDGSFLFFVQDGKVKGGFEGQITNPLQLQGKTP
jgi:hypothetical protein